MLQDYDIWQKIFSVCPKHPPLFTERSEVNTLDLPARSLANRGRQSAIGQS